MKLFHHLRSIRFSAIVALIAVVVAPLLFVLLSKPYELTISYHMQLTMEQARHSMLQIKADSFEARDAQIKKIAKTMGLRVRLMEESGRILHDHDYTVDGSWSDAFGAVGFTSAQLKRLKRYDLDLGDIKQRAVTREAIDGRAARGCSYSQENKLLVCATASRLEKKEGPLSMSSSYILHLQAASPRAIRSLYDFRSQIFKLSAQVLIVALIIGALLGWRMTSPLKQLRRQVVKRAQPPVSTRPVEVKGRDEVTEVARAFNQLLEAIEVQRQTNVAFMADMAHEIKNPVAAIRTCAESMARGVAIDEARAARYARILKSSSERLDVLVSRFLELANAEAGLDNVARDTFNLGLMLTHITEHFEADERYDKVVFEQDIENLSFHGAAEPIETAIRNLIDNAASFALLGERVVRISLSSEDENNLKFTVFDAGPGIAPEDLDKIFDRFFTRRADDRGTGLGLAMTRAVVTAHGGEIKVDSEKGKGTSFIVTLPIHQTNEQS